MRSQAWSDAGIQLERPYGFFKVVRLAPSTHFEEELDRSRSQEPAARVDQETRVQQPIARFFQARFLDEGLQSFRISLVHEKGSDLLSRVRFDLLSENDNVRHWQTGKRAL